MTFENDPFADLEDDFSSAHVIPSAELVQAGPVDQATAHAALDGDVFVEICTKCRGTGIFYGRSQHGSKCFPCKGAGKFVRKTSPEARARAKANAAALKARKASTALETFAAEHPDAWAWIEARAPSFGFAANMRAALEKYGHLTEGQLAAVARLIVGDAERASRKAAEAAQRDAAAPVLDISLVEAAINQAVQKGAKRVMLRLASFKFSPAKANSTNAGAIYVKSTAGQYLGKVQGGKFKRAFECDAVTEAEIVRVASDPKAAAIAYGREFGQCSCCGRELSDPESIALGIGPVCAAKYF